jgi:Tol biopolymer transport system component
MGTTGDDVIQARGGHDVIRGVGGDDVICGGVGADDLIGGEGNDKLYGGPDGWVDEDRAGYFYHGDRIVGGSGDDVLDGGYDPLDEEQERDERGRLDVLDFTTAASGVVVDVSAQTATGEGADTVTDQRWEIRGSRHDDDIAAGAFDDELIGQGGSDRLAGADGRDQIDDGDWMDGSIPGSDALLGGPGDDRLDAGRGPDELDGGDGDDQLYEGGSSNDTLRGGSGNDDIEDAGRGLDHLFGDDGDDVLGDNLVEGTDQGIDGGAGHDSAGLGALFRHNQEPQAPPSVTDLRTGTTTVEWFSETSADTRGIESLSVPNRWTVYGTDAAESISGWSGPITVYAGGGDDSLGGTPRADHLDGGDGDDRARPGRGLDTCISIEHTPNLRNLCEPSPVNHLVSTGPGNRRTSGPQSGGLSPQISRDGRYVAFQTPSALVPGDTNGVRDVYVRDRERGRTTRVSVGSRGQQLARASSWPAISATGRFVTFSTGSAGVLAGLGGGAKRVFLRDLRTSRTELVSQTSRERPANGDSFGSSISEDGRIVAFESWAPNLGAWDVEVFVRDRQTGRTRLLSTDWKGRPSSYGILPKVTPDGRRVLFYSESNLTKEHDGRGLYVADLARDTTRWVGRPVSEHESSSISDDGRVVAFTSRDPDCTASAGECLTAVVRNTRTDVEEIASAPIPGTEFDGPSYNPQLSGDGRFVLFTSRAGNIVVGDDNLATDVFVRDRRNGRVRLVSVAEDGGGANGPSGTGTFDLPNATLSGDGVWAVFASKATNLVLADENGAADVFARRWGVGFYP